MRIISKRTLRECWAKHALVEQPLKVWHQQVSQAAWRGPSDVKRDFPSASILPSKRVVFNIKGNHFRMIVRINYEFGLVWVRFVGTHEEYNNINANTI